MENIETLLKLPFETLALVSAGYLSYRVAYTGKDGNHATIDTVFLTLVFSFIAKLASTGLSACSLLPTSPVLVAVLGIFAAICAAAVWRKWVEEIVFEILRKFGVSASDRHYKAWESMLARPRKNGPTRLFVKCTDGTRLLCEQLIDFQNAPYGPCLLGQDGSIAMYVTHRMSSDTTVWETDQVAGDKPDWGCELTFISADQISEVRINFPFTP